MASGESVFDESEFGEWEFCETAGYPTPSVWEYQNVAKSPNLHSVNPHFARAFDESAFAESAFS